MPGSILVGDVRDKLAELAEDSVDCVITSPPYFQLRLYGHPGQLGMEANIGQWVANLRAVCREIARALKPTGSFWLNVGDGYSRHEREGAAKRSLLLGPQRLAIALAEDGWLIRNQVIWAKTNNMPSSVANRLSCKYEVLFFLTRSRRYFCDLDAVRVPFTSTRTKQPGGTPYRRLPDWAVPERAADGNLGLDRLKVTGQTGHPLGRTPGDVWSLPAGTFRGCHFATFPKALVELPLVATCPERVCVACGSPWNREPVDRGKEPVQLGELRPGCACGAGTRPGLVLDPFLGSGTVALVAEERGREWVGVELNPRYARVARQRIAKAAGLTDKDC